MIFEALSSLEKSYANKTIASEISMLGDYLRLEGNKCWKIFPAPADLTNRICPRTGNLANSFARGLGFDWFLKICPRAARMITLGID